MLELVDALCSQTTARSVVELSLQPCFRRSYSALFKAVAECRWPEALLANLAAPHLPPPRQRSFWLLGVDVTPQPRPYAPTLAERGFVYQPSLIKGNKPVTIGHQYSQVVYLPEPDGSGPAQWVVPLANRRVRSGEDKEAVGAAQLDALLANPQLPFHGHLCVEVGDTSYSKPAYLGANRRYPKLVSIVRSRSNRTFYCPPTKTATAQGPGHPTWYGAPFSLQDPSTWPAPAEQLETTYTSRRGRTYRLVLQGWPDLRMRGKRQPAVIPMHQYPFTLVRIGLYDAQGHPAFRRPLWLLVVGERRRELSLPAIQQAYAHRYDLEHFFRFGKQKLLLASYQTPEVTHEETWWQLGCLAYLQLWVARPCAQTLPRPWERHLPAVKAGRLTPALVQRDFGRIIRQLGTPASAPKRRGYSPGRRPGLRLPPRPRHKVVLKGQKPP